MKRWLCLALALPAAGSFAPAPAAETNTSAALVYVIPIRGMIESALLYVIRRGVHEAESHRARALVLTMDTPGGTVAAAEEIIKTLSGLSMPTYTLVEKNAISAGAIIALATDHIYMTPGSKIGDAMPVMMSPLGGVQEIPPLMQEKSVSYVAGLVRSVAQRKGHDDRLAEAMVRPELEYQVDGLVISPSNQLLTLTNVEAERRVGPDRHPLLSEGTVSDLAGLLTAVGLADCRVEEMRVTGAERLARWITMLAPLLLIGGLLGLYIEFKTPGFGLPGILGILCLAVFFWGHHVAGLAGMEELLVFLLGLALLLAEIFIIPGFGAAGIAGLLLMAGALFAAMIQHYPSGPWYPSWAQVTVPIIRLGTALLVSLGAAVALARWLPAMPGFNRLALDRKADRSSGFTAAPDQAGMLGLAGRALSALRPAGVAEIADRKCDVVTRGEFLAAGTRVRVAAAEGGRLVVEAEEPGS